MGIAVEQSGMLGKESDRGVSRADQRIPKLRTRGRANRERLLAAAQHLIEEFGGKPIRFSEVFETAGVSRGSAYRIYNGIDDLMQDLAASWISNFVAYISAADTNSGADSWTELSDRIIVKSVEYWAETEQTLRVLPRVRINMPESYRLAVKDLAAAIAEKFDRSFDIPEIPEWHSVIGMYVHLADSIFSDAVRRDGHISEQRLREAQKIGSTYLAFYLPTWLPARQQAPSDPAGRDR